MSDSVRRWQQVLGVKPDEIPATNDRLDAARGEAERQASDADTWAPASATRYGGFMSGVEWADANPQPATITQDELNMAAIEVVGDRLPARGPRAYDLLHDALIALGIRVEGDER